MWLALLLASSLSLERLYSLPSVIGTAPGGAAWSADSTRVAFLWNDSGRPFRDVWVASVDYPTAVRLTTLEPDGETDPGVARVAFHPDGERVLFERNDEIYLLRQREAPSLLANGHGAVYGPGSESESETLAFLRDGDLCVDNRAECLVTDPRREIYVREFRWAPDGSRLAFVEHDERRVPLRGIPDYLKTETELETVRRPFPGEAPVARRLGIVDLDGELTYVGLGVGVSPEELIFSFRWSPTGQLLVDRSDLYVKSRRIVSFDPSSGTLTEWYREDEPDNVTAYWQAEWASGGRGIYFLSDRDDDYHIYFLATPGGEPRRITAGEFAVAELTVTPDALVYVANAPNPEERNLFRVGPSGGEPVRVGTEPGTHAPVVSPDGRWAAVAFSSDTSPPDLYLTSLSDDTRTRLTQSPLPEFYQETWITPEYVTFPSHVDGTTLYGRLLVPAGLDRSRKHPVILGSTYANTVRNQWGGRNAHPVWGLDQFLLNRGFILFTVDVRGSWGRGKAHRRGIGRDYGGIDVEDLESGVRYLGTLGYADLDRVGIWGSSYGGLLTCMSLFKKPELYRAGVAGAPATNVYHALTGEMRVMMAPQDEPAAYEAASAYTHAAGLADPLMIIHGMRDRIVLYKDSVALVERLIELGKDVDFVTLPDSGHGWDLEELHQTRFAFGKLVRFFERHLRPERDSP